MNKKLAMNLWLIQKYAERYLKESGKMKEQLADKLQELQEQQTDLVKNFKPD